MPRAGRGLQLVRVRKWLWSVIAVEVEERRDKEIEIKALLLGGVKHGSLNIREGNPIRSRLLCKQNTRYLSEAFGIKI